MLISDLPIELQELVHKRQIEQGNDGLFTGRLSNSKYYDNFEWDKTKEGHDFWAKVNNEINVSNDKYYPKSVKIVQIY